MLIRRLYGGDGMLIVAAYDVDTTKPAGAKRLRKVAKICEKWGVRVQNSVFELLIDQAQFTVLQAALEQIIDAETDSIRFYRLGNHYEGKISVMGKPLIIQQDQPLIL